MAKVVRDVRDGRWLARWRDPSGRQCKKSFRRRVDAERFLAEKVSEMSRGTYLDPTAGKLTVGAFASTWSSGLAHLKPSTAERYRAIVQCYVLPRWGSWPLASVSRSDIASWVGDLHASGLSAGSVRKAYLVLSLILAAAVNDRRIPLNPASGVRLPRQVPGESRFLTGRELQALAEAAGPSGLVIVVLGLTGLRFGELAALRVRRIDAARRRFTISESVTIVGSTLTWSTPKAHRTRSVPVPPALLPAVLDACQGKSGDDLVFTSPMGGPLRLNNWRRRVFDPACSAVGLVGVTPHDLRHTAASLAIAAGANVKAVQHMLGHASAAMPLDIYAGLFGDDLDAVAASLDRHVPHLCHNQPLVALSAVSFSGANAI